MNIPNRQNTLPVYIYNSVEDEWSYINGLKKKSEQLKRIRLSNAYADSYLFANAGRPEFVFVSPVKISPDFQSYFESISGSKVTVITPRMTPTPFISENLIRDRKAFGTLLTIAKQYRKMSLFPYVATSQVLALGRTFNGKGVYTDLPESPNEKGLWTVPTYGSKSGFRELISTLPRRPTVSMPAGTIHAAPESAIADVTSFLLNGKSVLLKISRGSGGHGTYILRNGKADAGQIAKILDRDPLWKQQKIVVEEYVETDKNANVKFPSIEGFVDEFGKNHILYHCNMLVTPEGNFFGMEVGPEALPQSLCKKMSAITKRIGNIYAKNGYRGHFDIDMIVGKNGKLYVNESNTRNTGGTDAYKIAYHLLGNKLFKTSFLLSKFIDLPEKKTLPSFRVIHDRLKKTLYCPETKTGIILSSEASLKENSVTYFIIAKTKKQAYAIEKNLIKLLTF